jgi:uncharacterized protein
MDKFYVFDTNVIVSAILSSDSVPRKAFNFAFNNGIILLSNSVWNELKEVLKRPKFAKYISDEKRNRFLWELFNQGKFIDIVEEIKECRDEKDNKFLELAVSGKADFIITGDNDLLVLNLFRNIQIITSKSFLELHN